MPESKPVRRHRVGTEDELAALSLARGDIYLKPRPILNVSNMKGEPADGIEWGSIVSYNKWDDPLKDLIPGRWLRT